MRAGRLRHRVRLERKSEVNTDGSVTYDWVLMGEVWAAVEPIRGREAMRAGMELASMGTRITLRYNTLSAQLVARDRIVHNGLAYNLQGDPVEVRTEHRELECMCESGANSG